MTGTEVDEGNIIIFGPQCLTFAKEDAARLFSDISDRFELAWILNTIQNLRDYWCYLSQSVPLLQQGHGAAHLRELTAWAQTGISETLTWPLPNIVLTPLVVAQHLAEFHETVKSHSRIRERPLDSVTIGLCTGLLGSAAVSCSDNWQEFSRNGAVAIRLAMLIGAVVDATDSSLIEEDQATSFSVVWTQSGGRSTLNEFLHTFENAYISVTQSENKVTVTAMQSTAKALIQTLKQHGFGSVELPLRGRFHWQGHSENLQRIIAFCQPNSDFHFISEPNLPLIAHHNISSSTELVESIVKSILVTESDWHGIFVSVKDMWDLQNAPGSITCIGPERYIPSSLRSALSGISTYQDNSYMLDSSGDHVAVIGMACQTPGAADINEFWELICRAESQHVEVPPKRIRFDSPWRQSSHKKWYGNFVDDYDAFDERFFGKSAREAASTDPQQRLMLQVAYQAVEQSGYLSHVDNNIGCYIAVGLNDYEQNITHYPATAYSATGNLRAFAAGKISHFFGWTGPGITLDSACSSSSVAIHLACQSLLTKECNAALVGGVNILTGSDWFHNLAGASFLSPTGQCKPFDANADGYCRGESVGAVFLKRLPSAIQDGDHILGVIAASGVQQNANTTSITVPNESSLESLFRNVTKRAGISPSKISYVEAHGTGTVIGDPVEYNSIRNVFGGSNRRHRDNLKLGSIKGLLGHSEAGSGIVALLKILVMIQHGVVPPQASLTRPSPALNATPADNIDINTGMEPWDSQFRAALINNYGASGSNASLVVTQPPLSVIKFGPRATHPDRDEKLHYPFAIYALNERAIRRYSSKLHAFIQANESLSLADISYQLARQSNRSLRCMVSSTCKTKEEFLQTLEGWNSAAVITVPRPRPVILCFGGQRTTFVGLSKLVYNTAKILRTYLDKCDAICKDLGTTIYPVIHQTTSVSDVVQLHASLFCMQYSSAKSWIDCMPGTDIAVVGHSFGELAALCVSGVASLEHMLEFVIERAKLIRDSWGPEKGSMVAVEADLETVKSLLKESSSLVQSQHIASIACYNGPRSFTIAGPGNSIDEIVRILKEREAVSSLRFKRLEITNAYHCSLVDCMLPAVAELSSRVKFQQPFIHLELATEYTEEFDFESFLATHLRRPVYFSDAVRRLSTRFDSAIWLEAGSSSTVTMMANRALPDMVGARSPSGHYFQPVNLSVNSGPQATPEVTSALWREGIKVTFWSHYRSQVQDYQSIVLPPYQFEKTRHWLERKSLQPANTTVETCSDTLWSLVGFEDAQKRSVRFRIHNHAERFMTILKGHVIAQSHPLCPTTLQLDIAIDALMSVNPHFRDGTYHPQMLDTTSIAPMFLDLQQEAWLYAYAVDDSGLIWEWSISSTCSKDDSDGKATKHVTGRIAFYLADDAKVKNEFAKLERLIRSDRCANLLHGNMTDDVIQGRQHIYTLFSDVVKYDDRFRGLDKLVSNGKSESAARVNVPGLDLDLRTSWLDYSRADCFCQVAGIFVNVMTNRPPDDIYISDRIDQWIRSPRLQRKQLRQYPSTLEVYACHQQPSEKEFLSDVFVFETTSNSIVEAILGIHYKKIPKLLLTKAKEHRPQSDEATRTSRHQLQSVSTTEKLNQDGVAAPRVPVEEPVQYGTPHDDIARGLRSIITDLSGLEDTEIQDGSLLADIGIDSLMAMELTRELEATFECKLNSDDFYELTDFKSLLSLLEETLGVVSAAEEQAARSSAPAMSGLITDTESLNTSSGQNGVSYLPLQSGPTLSAGLSPRTIIQTFMHHSKRSDEYVQDARLSGYSTDILPQSDALCIAYICDAFERLGCSLSKSKPGQTLNMIRFVPRHTQFVALLYELLETKACLIERRGENEIIRTSVPLPTVPADVLSKELSNTASDFDSIHRLTALIGSRLAECLLGSAEGVQLIFGSPEGRALAAHMYGESPINTAWITQLADILQSIVSRSAFTKPLNILELGAGTGGTTARIVSLLASLGVPVTYTISDISTSLVAAARKRFKTYPFVRFRVIDIEAEPLLDPQDRYDIVLATNCVHATQNLARSTSHILQMLHPNGCLIMLEMTEPQIWVDLVFGVLEGWWVFNDGRAHALVSPCLWESTLYEVGYKRVEWTDGTLPESKIQRLILAMATNDEHEAHVPPSAQPVSIQQRENDLHGDDSNQRDLSSYIQDYTTNFSPNPSFNLETEKEGNSQPSGGRDAILVTGATGSLGCHLVGHLSSLSRVSMIVCLNRSNEVDPQLRQEECLRSKGINLSEERLRKLRFFQTDTNKTFLGLDLQDYKFLARNITSIVHNAWPMSMRRPIAAFETQFAILRNLIQLAVDAQACQKKSISFQFISSISVVGLHPHCKNPTSYCIPEAPSSAEWALPNGYSGAKYVCEEIVAATLGKYPEAFRTVMSVRIGQISGSRVTGYWNPVEHFAFLVKSSKTLGILPDLKGTLSWCPVDVIAVALTDLLLPMSGFDGNCGIFHIENPARQDWEEMIRWLSVALDVQQIVPLEKWADRVRGQPSTGTRESNPAGLLSDFWDRHFMRMSCGRLVLSTERTQNVSQALRGVTIVDRELLERYIQWWKNIGFL